MSGTAEPAQLLGQSWRELVSTNRGLWSSGWASGLVALWFLFASVAGRERWQLFVLAVHVLTLTTKVLGSRSETAGSREAPFFQRVCRSGRALTES